MGYLPEAMLNFLATLGHSFPDGRERFSLDELIQVFDLDRINVAGPVFDLAKLKHLQGQWFRDLPEQRVREEIHAAVDARMSQLLPMFRERMIVGGDFVWQAEPFYAEQVHPHLDDLVPKGWDAAQTRLALEAVQGLLKSHMASETAAWDAPTLERIVRELADARTWPPKQLFMCMRVALTGRRESPPLFDTMAAIGNLRCIERLGSAQQKLR